MRALRVVWLVVLAVALLGFICVPLESGYLGGDLGKKNHTTEYGLKEKG
jgi:hypothetical protein